MNKEQLKQIFIEEATEIIEQLDIKIIDFEEDPTNKDLLNDLFRGVHTLKGSANSFGFSKLGEFVHHFEDLLDYHRNSDEEIATDRIDLFLDAVDIIKGVFEFEVGNLTELPSGYQDNLDKIQKALNLGDEEDSSEGTLADLSDEFDEDFDIEEQSSKTTTDNQNVNVQNRLEEGESLFLINLHLDTDSYFRGFDHAVFFKILSQVGRILESNWHMNNIPTIQKLNPQECYIQDILIFLATRQSKDDVLEVFEFLEEEEYKIEELNSQEEQKEETPAPIKEKPIVKEAPVQEIKEEKSVEKKQNSEVKKEPPAKPAPTSKPKENSKSKIVKKPHKKEEKRSFVKIDTQKLDELFDSVGELVIAQNFLAENKAIKDIENEQVNKTLETLFKITKLIQNRVMSLRMVPIKDTFDKMKRVIRDASKKVDKKVNLIIQGEDTEIDKTMVDSLSDPLIHIIRNAVDHGLEASDEDRVKAGKNEIGNVTLRAYHKGGNIAIEIGEDGRGINRDKVLSKAIENGIASEDEEYTDQQIYSFIMKPGFSTADKISDISGRGVGLDVVNTGIEKLLGKVEIESKEGEGTKFTILLPLTLAIIDGMLVESADEIFIIPILSIIESFRPSENIVHTVNKKGEFVNLREELLPIIRLNEKLDLNDKKPKPWESTLVCVESEKGKFAILVDELIGRQQVVIKPLGKALSSLKEISGGAIMGNGEIALILNIEELHQ